jgi:hypothetical protein
MVYTHDFRIRSSNEIHCGLHMQALTRHLAIVHWSWKLKMKVTVLDGIHPDLWHTDLVECRPLPAEKPHQSSIVCGSNALSRRQQVFVIF